MKRTLFVMAVVLGFAAAASAATLSVVSDQATYNPGDTITLSIIGDDQGGTAYSLFGRLEWANTASASGVSATANLVGTGWVQGTSPVGAGFAHAFDQLIFPGPGTGDLLAPGGSVFATVTLLAGTPGIVNVDWAANLSFFGIAGPLAGTSFEVVPEPTTAVMLGLGLLGLAFGGRRRS